MYFDLMYFIGLIPMSFLIYLIVDSYLTQITFLSNVLYYFFFITLICGMPVILISLGYMTVEAVQNASTKKLIKRGYSAEEANQRIRRRR